MKQFEKLDFVLQTIAIDKKFINSKELFEKINNTIDENEFTPIINELFFNNYIEKNITDSASNSKLMPPYFCRVTFKGLLFIEQNGYLGQNVINRRNELWKTTKTIANGFNAFAILLIALLSVYLSWDTKIKEDEIKKKNVKIEKLEKELKNILQYKKG